MNALADLLPASTPIPTRPAFDLEQYDTLVIAFSSGKDSVACLLHLLHLGVDRARIELWHHDIDGREGSRLMDWPVTRSYAQAVAAAFEVPIYFSWKQGGFEREMLRDGARTAPICFETPDGDVRQVGGTGGKLGTRLRFPQVSADLSVRWCSSYAKVDVCASALRNQDRFNGRRTLVITGERAQESSARARYSEFETHRADNRYGASARWIDHWRPVHAWSEEQVWDIMRRYRVAPHPAYELGWSRTSCLKCIFGSRNQWASVRQVDPDGFEQIARYEERFGVTIQRGADVRKLADLGTPYASITPERAAVAMSDHYDGPVLVSDWQLPAGAFGEGCGPT